MQWDELTKFILAVISCQKENVMALDLALMQIVKAINVHLPESLMSL